MAAFLINPEAQTVVDVEPLFAPELGLLENVRRMIEAPQVSIIGLANNQLALIVDNFGLLKKNQHYFRFIDGQSKIAGKALLFAIDKPTGQIAPVRPDAIEDIVRAIAWCPDVTLLRVEEQILIEPGTVPQIARIPVWSDDPEPEVLRSIDEARAREHAPARPNGDGITHPLPTPPPPLMPPPRTDTLAAGGLDMARDPELVGVLAPPSDTGWIVTARQDGTVRATAYRLEENELRPGAMLSAPDLKALRELLPEGLERIEPSDDDPPEVLETWIAATPAAAPQRPQSPSGEAP